MAVAPGYGLGGVRIPKGASEAVLRLPKAVTLKGRLLAKAGRPAVNMPIAVVALTSPEGMDLPLPYGLLPMGTVTDAKGNFRIEGLSQGGGCRLGSRYIILPSGRPAEPWATDSIELPKRSAYQMKEFRIPASTRR